MKIPENRNKSNMEIVDNALAAVQELLALLARNEMTREECDYAVMGMQALAMQLAPDEVAKA